MAFIDLTSDDMRIALDEWAESLGLLADVNAALLRDLREHFNLDDGLVLFEQVRATDCVKLAGEWWFCRGRQVEHDLEGNPHRFLIVGDRDTPDWRYEVGDGERFLTASPF